MSCAYAAEKQKHSASIIAGSTILSWFLVRAALNMEGCFEQEILKECSSRLYCNLFRIKKTLFIFKWCHHKKCTDRQACAFKGTLPTLKIVPNTNTHFMRIIVSVQRAKFRVGCTCVAISTKQGCAAGDVVTSPRTNLIGKNSVVFIDANAASDL